MSQEIDTGPPNGSFASEAAGARPRVEAVSPLRRRAGAMLGLTGAGAALAWGVLGLGLSFGPPLVVLGLGGLALALVGLTFYRVLDPLVREDPERFQSPQAPARRRELERDKQAVLKAIREVELDYQMRKIAEPDYHEMVQRYRARALRIMRELDAGDDYRTLIEQELKTRLAGTETREER